MSTRANIIVKVPAKYIGKTINFDPSKLHTMTGHWDKVGDDYQPVPHDSKPRFPLLISGNYLSIFTHWDGYPSHMGKILHDHYNDLDKALNLLAGGWIEAIDERYYDAWIDNGATNSSEFMPTQTTKNPGLDNDWAYLWKDGEWYATTWSLRRGTKWAKLADLLASDDPDLDND